MAGYVGDDAGRARGAAARGDQSVLESNCRGRGGHRELGGRGVWGEATREGGGGGWSLRGLCYWQVFLLDSPGGVAREIAFGVCAGTGWWAQYCSYGVGLLSAARC